MRRRLAGREDCLEAITMKVYFMGAAKTVTGSCYIVEAAGAGMEDVVSVTVYLADISYFAEFNEIYKRYFTPPFPTRTTVSCSLRGILVEVNAIAEL